MVLPNVWLILTLGAGWLVSGSSHQLVKDTAAEERNAACHTIQWQFTSQQARTKLADLYPVTETKIN